MTERHNIDGAFTANMIDPRRYIVKWSALMGLLHPMDVVVPDSQRGRRRDRTQRYRQ